MRKLVWLAVLAAFGLLGLAAQGTTAAKKKSGVRKGTRPAAASSASKRGKKGPARRAVTWRTRQLTPTPERYKEIQRALSAKGYLPAEQATGKWDDASAEALKRFQVDQNLDGTGKINSLSLIALGLGPKRDSAAKVPAAPPPGPAAPVAPAAPSTPQ